MAATQYLVLTFCLKIRCVPRRKLKLLMPVLFASSNACLYISSLPGMLCPVQSNNTATGPWPQAVANKEVKCSQLHRPKHLHSKFPERSCMCHKVYYNIIIPDTKYKQYPNQTMCVKWLESHHTTLLDKYELVWG